MAQESATLWTEPHILPPPFELQDKTTGAHTENTKALNLKSQNHQTLAWIQKPKWLIRTFSTYFA
uniref:Uncharacterized protein n=1 Tax=Anguilla anguilla TaxID=7936 RepID=A0A0E9VX18_ANGAN